MKMYSASRSPSLLLRQLTAQAVPPDILPAGYFYLLWDFTLTSWTLGRPGNTKATFQSSLKDNGLPCNFSTSPMQEMNSSTGKSNNLRRELRKLGDLTIPFPTIRRSGDEVSRFSSASHPGYHPPTGWQTVTQTWRVIGKRDHLLCFSLGFDSSCEKIQYISNILQSDNWDEGATGCNRIRISLQEGQDWIIKSHFM